MVLLIPGVNRFNRTENIQMSPYVTLLWSRESGIGTRRRAESYITYIYFCRIRLLILMAETRRQSVRLQTRSKKVQASAECGDSDKEEKTSYVDEDSEAGSDYGDS